MPTTWVQPTTCTIPINYNRCWLSCSVPSICGSCPLIRIVCWILAIWCYCCCWHFFQPIRFVNTKWTIDAAVTLHRFFLSHVIAIDVVGNFLYYYYYCRCCVHIGHILVHHIFTLISSFLLVRLSNIIFSLAIELNSRFFSLLIKW